MRPTDPKRPEVADLPEEVRPWTLREGVTLGPYEVVGLIGRGGMGEVYAAKDTRLGRAVAVKVLPAARVTDTDALRRFEIEARAAATINHPNVLAVHDVGAHDGVPYVVAELLEGETLRTRILRGPIPERRVVEIARQVALGLGAAHDKGIVHRDLKPENVFVTADGHVKILDFGVAKLLAPQGETGMTETGAIVGTPAYMSPEQLRGMPADRRSDLFTLGVVMYEMSTSRRPFGGDGGSPAEVMSAILGQEPEPAGEISAGLTEIIGHCLEKDPSARFQTARDLAFALATLTRVGTPAPVQQVPSRRMRLPRIPRTFWQGAALAIVFAAGWLVARPGPKATPRPTYHRITFPEGWIGAARFVHDGSAVFYQGHWSDRPEDIYTVRPESPESRRLGLPAGAVLASVSRTDELAVILDARPQIHYVVGTLARVPAGGGIPRPVEDSVSLADFAPDGQRLAIVKVEETSQRLEYPRGHVLFETSGSIDAIRFSPSGDQIAFLAKPMLFEDIGRVMVVDLAGHARAVTREYYEIYGLAWNGDEIWFTAGASGPADTLWAVRPGQPERIVETSPGSILLYDIAPGGHMLLGLRVLRHVTMARAPGASEDKNLSWLDQSELRDLTADGSTALISETGLGSGPTRRVYLRRTDGDEPVLLGEGEASSVSPDGRSVLRTADGRTSIEVVPAGTGEVRKIKPAPPLPQMFNPAWFPDGKRIVVTGIEPGHGPRLYVVDPDGASRPISPDGVREYSSHPVSPGGAWAAGFVSEGNYVLVPTDGGETRPVVGLGATERVSSWLPDGRLVVFNAIGVPCRVFALDPATGQRELLRELRPEASGVYGVRKLYTAKDGYAYSMLLRRDELYLVEGAK